MPIWCLLEWRWNRVYRRTTSLVELQHVEGGTARRGSWCVVQSVWCCKEWQRQCLASRCECISCLFKERYFVAGVVVGDVTKALVAYRLMEEEERLVNGVYLHKRQSGRSLVRNTYRICKEL